VHIIPILGRKKLHKLTGVGIRLFMQCLRNTCSCSCLHGYDERRGTRTRCCAVGRCRRWEDIDSVDGKLQVRRTLQRVGGVLRAVTPKTLKSQRTVRPGLRCRRFSD
jgi:hypothetical protein